MIGLAYISKVDLTDVHMIILVCLLDIPFVAFLIPKDAEEEYPLVGSYLYIPTGYVKSSPLFFDATDMVNNRVNNTMQVCGEAPFHPLEQIEDYPPAQRRQPHGLDQI